MSYDVTRVFERLGLEIDRKKSRARRLWAHCPWGKHDDDDASFFAWTAGPKAGLNHCFSCKSSGTLPDLVAHVRKMGSTDDFDVWLAVEDWLRVDTLAAPPPKSVTVVPGVARGRSFALPPEVILEPYEDWPSLFREYLDERGVTPAQRALFQFGYALEGRLKFRLVLVVCDAQGRPRTYSARSVIEQPGPKYLTPHESEAPDKAAIYGMETWPGLAERGGRMRRPGRVYVAEGGFNTLALHRASGGEPVAGLLGSRVHPRQVLAIASFEEAVIVTDPDQAGDRAASKLLFSLARHGLVRRVVLPEGEDADSLGRGLPSYLKRRKV